MVYLQRCLVVTWRVPRESAAISAHVLCTPYNRAPVHSFIRSHILTVHMCLAVTCLLLFWYNVNCDNTNMERIPK